MAHFTFYHAHRALIYKCRVKCVGSLSTQREACVIMLLDTVSESIMHITDAADGFSLHRRRIRLSMISSRWCPFAKIQCVFRRLRWEFYFCRREMKTATKMHQTADDAVYYIVDCKLNMWLINLQFTQSFSCVSIKLCLCRWMTVNYRFIRTDWTVEFWVTYMQIDPKF